MAFGTKKSVVAAPSFSERMASIKSMYKTAHENASNLHAEMESEMNLKLLHCRKTSKLLVLLSRRLKHLCLI